MLDMEKPLYETFFNYCSGFRFNFLLFLTLKF